MFERVLEKVLLNVIGPYVDGIDKSNLKIGIWSGKVEVHNISVKPEVLAMFDLPLQMIFSSIGKLSLSIPWKNLGSKPIEILLEDVFIIIHPEDREKWERADLQNATQKLKMMNAFTKNYSSKISQKEQGSNDTDSSNSGLIAKLSEKAIDNIQVNIKNIHLRFEDPIAKNPYVFGVTLDEILLHTTNDKWEITFVDRTQPENKLLPMKKKLLLKNFGVYWTSAEKKTEIFGNLVPAAMHKKMQQHILRDSPDQSFQDYIVNINAECKLTQKNKKNKSAKDDAEFDILFYLAPINLFVKKTQLEDIIQLTSFFDEYKKFKFQSLKEKQNEVKDFMSESQLVIQKDEFQMLFKKIRMNDEEDGLQNMLKVRAALDGPEQAQLFEELLLSIPDEEIATVIKQSLKELEKEKRLRKLAEQNAEKKHGKMAFLKGLFKGHEKRHAQTQDESLWEAEDINEIEKYLDESISNDEEEKVEVAGEVKNLIRFKFISDGGVAILSNTLESGSEQGISFQYTGLSCDVSMTSQSSRIDVDLNDFDLHLKTRYSADKSFINTHVIRRVNYWLNPEKQTNIISFTYEDNPTGRPKGTYYKLKAQQVEIVYRKALIDRVNDIMTILQEKQVYSQQDSNINEAFQLEPAQNQNTATQQEAKKQFFDIDIKAPVLVVPFLQNGDLKSECWVLNFGHFIMKSKSALTEEDELYNKFELLLNDLKFQYYPSHGLYNKLQKISSEGDKKISSLTKEEDEENQVSFDLVEKFSLKIKVKQFLPGSEKKPEAKELSKLSVDILIPAMDLQLRDDVYKKLIQITEIFDFSLGSADIELAENERVKLMMGNDKIGTLYLREKKSDKTEWAKHFCILNGNYLYFFKHADDQRPVLTFYLKNAKLQLSQDTDQEHSFSIKNDKVSIHLAAESNQEKEDWMSEFLDKLDELHSDEPNTFRRSLSIKKIKSHSHGSPDSDDEESHQQHQKDAVQPDYESADLEVFFQIKDAKLTLLHLNKDQAQNNNNNKLLEINAKNLETNYLKQLKKSGINIRMASLQVKDFLHDHHSSHPKLATLITSTPPPQSELQNADLIDVKVFILEQDHPKYHETQTNVQVTLDFGFLYVNYKPQVVSKLLQFFYSTNENPQIQKSQGQTSLGSEPATRESSIQTHDNISHTLLNLHINFKQLELGFLHADSHVCLAELAFKNICIRFNQKTHFTELEAVLGNIQLFDTTNYPSSSAIHQEEIKRVEMIGMQNQDANLLEINYKSYDHQQREDNMFTFVDINMSNVRVNYIHQPFMRVISYVQEQLLPSLSTDSNQDQGQKKNPSSVPVTNKEDAEKTINNPRFMDLNIKVKSPIIILQPLLRHNSSQDHLEIQLGDLTVKSGVIKNYDRLSKITKSFEFIYCQKYDINMQNIGIWRVEGENRSRLTQKVSFNLILEMPTFVPEYQALMTPILEERFDEKMNLKGRMTPLVTVLSNQDLLLIKKILSFNILYDDGMDAKFSMESQALSDAKQPEATEIKSSQYNIDLRFDNFSFLALSEENVPFAMINLHIFQINIDQNDKNEMSGSIKAFEVNGSYFNKTNDKLFERQMLGHLNRTNHYSLSNKDQKALIEEIVTSTVNYTQDLSKTFQSKPETEKDIQFSFTFEFFPDNKSIYKIDLTELKVYLVPDILSKLYQLLQSNQESQPSSNTKQESKIEKPTSNAPTTEQKLLLRVEVDLRNILIILPAFEPNVITDNPYLLVLRGDILCGYDNYSEPSLEKVVNYLQDRTIRKMVEQCNEQNQTTQLKATLSQCELFICEFEDLVSTPHFSDVRKRNLILPFTVSYTQRTHFVPNRPRTQLVPVNKNELFIELLVLRMSYQDALLLNNTIHFQLEKLNQNEKPESEQRTTTTTAMARIKSNKTDDEEFLEIEETDNWNVSIDESHVYAQGIQILVINDANECLVPVFELTLQEVYGTVVTVKNKVSVVLKIIINCSYFNPLPSKWEPIIETFGLEIDIVKDDNPQLSVAITIDEDYDILNINISEEMIVTLHSTLMTWKDDYQKKIISSSQTGVPRVSIFGYKNLDEQPNNNENEMIDYISPYIIENQTGYPIEVEADTSHLDQGDLAKSKSKLQRSRSKKIQGLFNQVYKLENKTRTQYLVQSSIEEMFKQSLKEAVAPRNFITVRIQHYKFDISPITGIDIDRSYPTNYSLEVKSENGEDVFEKGLKLLYNVRIENHTKIITLSSPFKIYNTTQKSYSVKLQNDSEAFEKFLEPHQSFAVPLGFIDSQLEIKVKDADDAFSFNKSLREFMDHPLQLFESQIGSNVLVIKSRRKDYETDFYEVFIQSPFSIKNCCGTELIYRISQSADLDSDLVRLQPQEISDESSISTTQQVFLQVRIQGFFWSEKILIYSPNSKIKIQDEINLTDLSGNTVSLHIFTPQEKFATKKFLIYTKSCIINQTPYHLSYLLPGQQKMTPIPGQIATDADNYFNHNVILTDEIKRFVISNQETHDQSGVINIESADTAYVELRDQNQSETTLEMGIDISFMECDRDYQLYTQIIHINPRYVFVNKAGHQIEIKNETSSITLTKDERLSYQGKKQIYMRLRTDEEENLWDWSKMLNISNQGITNFKLRNNQTSETKFIKATVTFQGAILFVVLEQEEPETCELKIQNDIPGVQILVNQKSAEQSQSEVIKSGTLAPWAWEFPSGEKQVSVEFQTDQDPSKTFKTDYHFFNFNTFNQVQKVLIPEKTPSELKQVFAVVTMEGHTKILKFFTDSSMIAGRQGPQSPIRIKSETETETEGTSFLKNSQKLLNFNFEVNISGIGVSLISRLNNPKTMKKERREVLYLFLAGFQFRMLSSNENTVHQLRVKYLNLDNNTHYKTTFPVLLTPTKPKDLLLNDNNYMIDFLVSQKTNVDIPYFDTVKLLISEATLKADGMVLDAVLETVNNLSAALKNNEILDINTISTAECLYSNSEQARKVRNLDNLDYRFSWQVEELPEFTDKIFIKELVLHPIFVNVSFQLKKANLTENLFFLGNQFATALGSAIVNLDDAPVRLRGFKIENLFGSQGDILNKILDKLKDDGAKCLLKVIGSLDIIGNPTGLLENISTGVVELIERPRDGFLEGPLEGGKGIVKGAGVLMKNTVSGTFNSIGKITGSLASGFSNLSMDHEYLAQRERAKLKRPNHVGDGVYQGVHSVLQGLGYGVKGVIMKPYEGAQNDGMHGLLKGTMEGMTGLVVNPVTGVLDAASKTAEGVKNTAMMFDHQKPNHIRIRYPRAFYGKGKFYRSYVFSDAEINWLLHNSKDMRFEDISLVSTFDVLPSEENKENFFILALSYECVLCWSIAENKIIWSFNPKTIEKVNLYQNGMQIELVEPAEMLNEKSVMLLNCDPLQNEFIGKKLIELKHIE